MKSLLLKYKHFIAYAFFGVCTTVVNVSSYYVCAEVLSIANIPAVIIAWIIAIAFAFIVNKIWVFESRAYDCRTIIREALTFTTCRLLTGLIDIVIMYIAVDVCNSEPVVWKALSDLIAIVLNYLAMRFLVFIKATN